MLEAHANGSEVWANFLCGTRTPGWFVPMCEHWGCGNYDQEGYHDNTNTREAPRYEFRPDSPALDVLGRRNRWRHEANGFVPAATWNVLAGGWDQLMALRVYRDEAGRPHRCALVENANGEWHAERACTIYDCARCSKGLTVGIDELNQWAPARDWAKLGPGVLNRLAYVRKDSIDLHWSAQHERRIDTVPRELTEYILSCSSFGLGLRPDGRAWLTILGRGIRFQFFRREKWIPALMSDANRVVTGEGATGGGFKGGELELVAKWSKQLLTHEERSYNTYEHVQPAVGRRPKLAVIEKSA